MFTHNLYLTFTCKVSESGLFTRNVKPCSHTGSPVLKLTLVVSCCFPRESWTYGSGFFNGRAFCSKIKIMKFNPLLYSTLDEFCNSSQESISVTVAFCLYILQMLTLIWIKGILLNLVFGVLTKCIKKLGMKS